MHTVHHSIAVRFAHHLTYVSIERCFAPSYEGEVMPKTCISIVEDQSHLLASYLREETCRYGAFL